MSSASHLVDCKLYRSKHQQYLTKKNEGRWRLTQNTLLLDSPMLILSSRIILLFRVDSVDIDDWLGSYMFAFSGDVLCRWDKLRTTCDNHTQRALSLHHNRETISFRHGWILQIDSSRWTRLWWLEFLPLADALQVVTQHTVSSALID